MQQIKLWKIDENKHVKQINKEPLDFENRLEKWLIEDISIISSNLAVLGSQVNTPIGKKIDILAINSIGELIIIELKRDRTYREVVAQALDYATWVKDLDFDDLNDIVNRYGKSEFKDFDDFFSSTFNKDAEEIEFNSDHKMLIVGSEIDDSTIRIINYLSKEPYSVNINAINFNYFKDNNGNEFLAQSFILPEENITEESKSKKRKREKSIIAQLFDLKKLKVGDVLYYQPAIDNGALKTNPQIKATIVTTGTKCLQREGENEIYSLSRLRRKIVEELNLKDIKKNWGFGTRFEWVTEDETKLNDLIE